MQATMCFSSSLSSSAPESPLMVMRMRMMKTTPPSPRMMLRSASLLRLTMKRTTAALPSDNSVVDYNSSSTSVFPAEACETIGGDACAAADIYPEAKLTPEITSKTVSAEEAVDREYLEYDNNPKTVFPAEACDDLGGEFCEPEYQKGIYK